MKAAPLSKKKEKSLCLLIVTSTGMVIVACTRELCGLSPESGVTIRLDIVPADDVEAADTKVSGVV